MVEHTPSMDSTWHVHMGSPSYAIGSMPHAHFSSMPSSLPMEGEHTPPTMGFLEHAHVEAPSSVAPGDPGISSSSAHPPPDAPPHASPSSLRHLSRSGVRYRANKIAAGFFGDIDVDSRRRLLDALLRHPTMTDARAAAQIWSPRSRRVGAAVIDSVRRSYTSLSQRSSRDALTARRTLTAAVSSRDMTGMFRATSRMLCIRRHTLRAGARRREHLDLGHGETLWAGSGRAPRCTRILNDTMRDFIAQFWEMHTRALPDFKKALRHRVGRKQYIEHGAHILEMTQHELFCLFRETHPEIVISERTFEACRPWFIRFMRERDTCCCRYHVEFQLLYDVFRRAPGFDGVLPSSPRDFVHTLLCEREEGATYHRMACVEGTCLTCGHLQRFPVCAADVDEDGQIVSWQRYEYHVYTGLSGAQSRRLQLTPHSDPWPVFRTTFREAVYPYIAHAHGAKWQDRQFRACLASFPMGVVVSVVDFAENYTFTPQQEIQSEYYFSEQVPIVRIYYYYFYRVVCQYSLFWCGLQVAIMVHISYRHAEFSIDEIASTEEERVIIREYHFYISDDRSHSARFVQHCFHLHDAFLRERHITCTGRYIWSDGCGAQFKSARQFYWLYRWHMETGVQCIWSYFETGHGKGEHDGAGACVKRALRRYQLRRDSERFRDARQVVEWCTMHMGVATSSSSDVGQSRRTVRRFFTCVDGGDIGIGVGDCVTVDGTLKLHSIRSSMQRDPTVFTRRHSCFCVGCVHGDWVDCQMNGWADKWHEQILRPLQGPGDIAMSMDTIEMRFSEDADSLTDFLAEGDDFAVIAEDGNAEKVDYYILRCIRPKMRLQQAMVDDFGLQYDTHSMVVGGHYFQQIPSRGRSIQFQQYQWEKEAIHFSHLVLAVKLRLTMVHSKKGGALRWRLHLDDHESIMEIVRARAGGDDCLSDFSDVSSDSDDDDITT